MQEFISYIYIFFRHIDNNINLILILRFNMVWL